MKTPGQRQLIALQERVKLELISVNEAVQEFKAWQSEHERSNSLRCQQVWRTHTEPQYEGRSRDSGGSSGGSRIFLKQGPLRGHMLHSGAVPALR